MTNLNSKNAWTNEELNYLKRNSALLSCDEMAKSLGRSRNSVRAKMIRLGIYAYESPGHRYWTKEEEEYLENNYPFHAAADVAKHMGRSIDSVKRKAQSMNIKAYGNACLSLKLLAKLFHCDICVITKWIHKYRLPHKIIKRGNIPYYEVDPEKFWKWAEKHKDIIPWQSYEHHSILPEPDWVCRQSGNDPLNHRKPFTLKEKKKIIQLHKNGSSYADLADKYGRTKESIKHICLENPTL